MKDRQVLAREVEFLRKHLTTKDTRDLAKLLSTHHTLVDDILVNVKNEGVTQIKQTVIDEVAGMKAELEEFDDSAKDRDNEKYSSSFDTLDDVMIDEY